MFLAPTAFVLDDVCRAEREVSRVFNKGRALWGTRDLQKTEFETLSGAIHNSGGATNSGRVNDDFVNCGTGHWGQCTGREQEREDEHGQEGGGRSFFFFSFDSSHLALGRALRRMLGL